MNVTISVSATDNADSSPLWQLVSATSSEPDDGLGDGDTPDDIVIAGSTALKLRAERSGTGEGRIYTITYSASDACGNSTTTAIDITVPHDGGR